MAPLSQAFVALRPDLSRFKSDAERGISAAGLGKLGDTPGRQFGKQFGETAGKHAGESLSSSFGASVRRLGPGLLAAGGLLGVKEVFDKVVGGASAMNETISKSNVVFGNMAGKVQAAFGDAPATLGQTSQAANEAAATLGNLFVSMDLGAPKAAEMSVKMVQLASDLASFNNANPAEVMEALRAGLVGETEPLRRFGVNITDAALRAETMRLGLGEVGATLTTQQRTQAAYSLILAQTTTAQGDFARTSGGAANQQRILKAQLEETAATLGERVLPAYVGLLKIVNEVGPGTIIAAAGVAVLSNRIAESSAGASKFADVRAAFQLYSEAVTSGTPRITAAVETTKASLVGLRNVGSGIVGLFGGPWGLALTGATIGVGLLTNRLAQNKAQAEETVATYVRLGQALKDATSAGTVRTLIAQDEALQKLVVQSARFGISAETVTSALRGQGESIDAVNDALGRRRAELVATIAAHTLQGGRSGAVMDQQAIAARGEVQEIDRLGGSFAGLVAKQRQAADAAALYPSAASQVGMQNLSAQAKLLVADYGTLIDAVRGYTEAAKTGAGLSDAYTAELKALAATLVPATDVLTQYALVADSVGAAHLSAAQRADTFKGVLGGIAATAGPTGATVSALGEVFATVANAELTAADRANLLKQTWEQMYGPAINQTDATEAFNLALFGLKDSLDKGSTSLDINNAAGIRNRDTLQALIARNNDLYFANLAAGMSAEAAGKQHDTNAAAIEKAGRKAGLSSGEVHALNEEYGKIPPNRNTNVTVTGADAVLQQLRNLQIAQLALEKGISTGLAAAMIGSNRTGGAIPGLAGGGPVTGPGTDTSDNLWRRLSPGEHVITAAEVRAAGGHSAIEALRRVFLGRRSPAAPYPGDGSQGIAFAGGGAVWPFPVTVAKMKIPTTQWTPTIGAAQAFIRGQAGKPYIWASAGPDGYDCTGIVSAAWNIVHGRPTYAHTFSSDVGNYFPKPGTGLFTAAWTNRGEAGVGGGPNGVGHTRGRLGGLDFESRGGVGVIVGAGTTPMSRFAHIGHYDRGGVVPGPVGAPQAAIVHGGERVVTPGQSLRLDDYSIGRLAQALRARPVQVSIVGPDWGLGVAGVAP